MIKEAPCQYQNHCHNQKNWVEKLRYYAAQKETPESADLGSWQKSEKIPTQFLKRFPDL